MARRYRRAISLPDHLIPSFSMLSTCLRLPLSDILNRAECILGECNPSYPRQYWHQSRDVAKRVFKNFVMREELGVKSGDEPPTSLPNRSHGP